MKNLDFEWLTDEFMLYCRSTQLREKTMSSYEQTLHLFGRWLSDELNIYTADSDLLLYFSRKRTLTISDTQFIIQLAAGCKARPTVLLQAAGSTRFYLIFFKSTKFLKNW